MSNIDTFFEAYAAELERAVAEFPEDYAMVVKTAPRKFARKYTLELARGNATITNRVKCVCKQLGIQSTGKAIRAYFDADQIPGVTVPGAATCAADDAQ